MRPLVPRQIVVPDVPETAINRLRFLTTEPADEQESPSAGRVRPAILASWQRSRLFNIAPDKIEMPYVRDPNTDTPLTCSAEPVLRKLHERLNGLAVSVVLTDADGLVLSRRTDDARLEQQLDRVLLAPGFNYAERSVGTNGIGTALEAGSATQVFGHEHYAEHLENLACAGVPIHDPMSGRLVGVIDLTCWRKDAESLLITLARTTAEQIQQELLANYGLREFEVLQAYRQTCRRMSGMVLALTNDATMMNDVARADLDPADQAAVFEFAAETLATVDGGGRRNVEVVLPTGTSARLSCQSVGERPAQVGLVVHVKVNEIAARSTRTPNGVAMHLPGLIGNAPMWLRACGQVEQTVADGTWVVIEGEPGTGKQALLRAVQRRRSPAGRTAVTDAREYDSDTSWMSTLRESLAGSDSVLITHVDTLDLAALRMLSSALQAAVLLRAQARPLWVAVTIGNGSDRRELDQLLSLFPSTVVVPPLRLRREDVAPLVAFLLAKLGRHGRVTCSPEAMRVMMRSEWPGNVEQLQRLLHDIVQRRRAGTITLADLPPELHSHSRRTLSTLESIERDAIVHSLTDAGGNKVRAARALGMSRATIYRKIHEYGIVAPV